MAKRSLLVGMIPKRQVAKAEETSLGSPHNGNHLFPSCHIYRCTNKSTEENPPMRNNIFSHEFSAYFGSWISFHRLHMSFGHELRSLCWLLLAIQ